MKGSPLFSDFYLKLRRNPDTSKYDYGHVLVIAGSKYMPGAGILCCNAALRTGAGLVTYAVQSGFLNAVYALSKPETMYFVYETAGGILKFISDRKVSSVIIGPGLERNKVSSRASSEALYDFINEIISSVTIPVVLDACAISTLNENFEVLKKAKARIVITPHEGEFAKLIGKPVSYVKENREKLAENFAKDNSLICVLKGNKTLVSDGKTLYKNNSGTPAMASAGSGDVLSGMIAALSVIGGDLFEAVKFSAYVHGLAGEISEKDKGIGVIASDIVENIPYALKAKYKDKV
ncbi:MAG: NAD(P)H-hydrate dehydratase [Endomicrobia bacterium]|nr:NAD(P)H-hydrate dehydratase [Endomicrobiia bacterium]MCL2799773.1 NAD(P)H-hydrate dehydratase [Endomicrobiia bacterium]